MLPFLVAAFIVVPILEIYVIVQVAGGLGWLPTLAIVLTVSIVGAWLVKREGFSIWNRGREQLRAGRMPEIELVDGAMVVFAAALMLTPGFVTDTLGLLLLFPPSRAILRRPLMKRLRRKVKARDTFGLFDAASGFGAGGSFGAGNPFGSPGGPAGGAPGFGRRPGAGGDFIDADIVDESADDDGEGFGSGPTALR